MTRKMRPRLVAVGDNVVDRYPDLSVMYPGGNAVNVAVHANRCGIASSYIGAIGTDPAGAAVAAALVAEGVDTTRMRVVEGRNAFAVVRLVGGNRVFGSGDVGVSRFVLDPDDFKAAAAANIVHTGECSMIEGQLPELAAVAQRLSFDFSERPWEYVVEYAPHVDIALRSVPHGTLEAARDTGRRLKALGPSLAAVTFGSGGAVLVSGEETVHAPAPPGDIVDTLGAGDAFVARLLVGVLRGEPLAEVAVAATAYATASCASFGAFGYPTPTDASTTPFESIQHGGVEPS